MRLGKILMSFVAASLLFGTSANAEKRVALVLGNSKYQHVPSLPNPGNDAAAMAAMLRQAGFEVVDNRNDLDVIGLRRAIRDFADRSSDADVAVVYYAGHGIELGGTNFLIPVDAKLQTDLDLEDETVSLDRVLSVLDPVKKLRLVILDACRDNPFIKSIKRTTATRSISRGLAKVEPPMSDTLVAFAAKAGAVADDGAGANSPYTTALLKHLAVPGRDVRIAFGHVRDDVMQMTKRQQEPFVYGSLGGALTAIVPQTKIVPVNAPPIGASIESAGGNRNPASLKSLGNFAGKTIQIETLDQQQVITPVRRTSTLQRTVSVEMKSSAELPTTMITRSLDRASLSRTLVFVGAIDPDDGRRMNWSIKGNQLTGVLRSNMIWKSTIELKGSTCTATVAYEPPAGRTNYLLQRLSDNEPVIVASIVPKEVKCRVISATAQKRDKTR